VKQNFVKELDLHFLVNNLFDVKYDDNAWVYSYMYENGKRFKMDGYFPQAGINIMVGLNVRF
jgi:iron complex outermembrane receptor protein